VNPRFSNIPQPCNGGDECVCSTFDEDFIDYMDLSGVYPADSDGNGVPDNAAVRYLFCSNSRVNDISWCSMFDSGESFQEVIDHYRQRWQERYPTAYFRRNVRNFSSGSRAISSIIDTVKIYQHLFYRYFYEPEFRRATGPLGFNDQYLSSIDSMNWLAELAQLPDVGSYQFNAATNSYRHMGEDMTMTGSDFSLPPGQGFYTWSRYQDGLYGFFRLERAGVFWDKLIALQALTVRDWGLSFTIDERFFINFYDLFPVEMTELFGGYVTNQDSWMAPRVRMSGTTPEVYYLNYLRGQINNPTTGQPEPARGSNAETYTDPALEDTNNDIQRVFAAIYSLAEFPVFYDPTFERRLAIFKMDAGESFTIPNVQLDGQPTCGYRQAIPGSGHSTCATPEDSDYIIYNSNRLHVPFVAVKVRPRLTYNLEEEQLGFQLLLVMTQRQERVRTLEATCAAGCTPEQRQELDSARHVLQNGESFLETLIEVQRIFGISSWLI